MNWIVPLPVALPLLIAALLVALSPFSVRRLTDFLSVTTALTVTIICGWLCHLSSLTPIIYWFGDWAPRHGAAIGISFVIDPLGSGMAAFCAFLAAMSFIYTIHYFKEVRSYFHALMLLFLGAMTGFCLTGDLFNLFVFFELMSVTAYALAAYKVEEEQTPSGAFNFAITNSIGGFLILTGIALVYGRTGALNMAQAGDALSHHYLKAVLQGEESEPIQTQQSSWHIAGLLEGLSAAIGAAILAALALIGSRLPKPVARQLRNITAPVQTFLQKIHAGHIGDLVVWLLAGAVAIAFVLALK